MTLKTYLENTHSQVSRMWTSPPRDVERALSRTGHNDYHFSPTFMIAEELRVLADEFWFIREAIRGKNLDAATAGKLINALLTPRVKRLESWYLMRDAPQVFAEASELCLQTKSLQDLQAMLEAIVVYIGRLQWWFDLAIPWDDLSGLFEQRKKA